MRDLRFASPPRTVLTPPFLFRCQPAGLFAFAAAIPLVHALPDKEWINAICVSTAHRQLLRMFRRFRAEVLRKAGVPEDLVRQWMGHAGHRDEYGEFTRTSTVTDL